jgi:hypothetical protein
MYILLQMPQQLIPVCTYLPMRQAVSGMTVDTWQLARENLSSTWLHVMRYIRSPQSQQNPGFVLNVGSGSAARWTGLCIKTFISGILAPPRRCLFCMRIGLFPQIESHACYIEHIKSHIREEIETSGSVECPHHSCPEIEMGMRDFSSHLGSVHGIEMR